MVQRAFGILLAGALIFVGLGLHLRDVNPTWAHGLFWGVPGGLICAVSAVGIALWADRRKMSVKHAFAVVVVGMLFRMVFLAAWTILAILVGKTHAFAFLTGFGGVYLTGQALEVWLLARLGKRREDEAARPAA